MIWFLPVEFAPLRRKALRAVRSPSFTAHFFADRGTQVVLHEQAGRAMVTEGFLP
jgi:hypothetical protein